MSVERSLLDRTDRNQAAIPLLALPQALIAALLVGVIALVLVPWWVALVAAAVTAGVLALLLPRTTTVGVDRVIGGRPVDEDEFPRFHNLMESLAIGTGSEVPELRVLDEPAPNLAVYGPPDGGVVVATSGLLELLDRVELEGVLAEAYARLRSHDADLGAKAAAYVCGPLVRNGPRRPGRPMWMVTPGASARSARLARVLGDQREFLSDLAAVDITRYPPGLGAALEKMESTGTGVESATWGTAHLWLADPLLPPTDGDAVALRLNGLFSGGAPIDQRASLMAEL